VATARSSTSVDVIAIGRESFQTLLANFPPLRGLFEELITMRSAAAGERLIASAESHRGGDPR